MFKAGCAFLSFLALSILTSSVFGATLSPASVTVKAGDTLQVTGEIDASYFSKDFGSASGILNGFDLFINPAAPISVLNASDNNSDDGPGGGVYGYQFGLNAGSGYFLTSLFGADQVSVVTPSTPEGFSGNGWFRVTGIAGQTDFVRFFTELFVDQAAAVGAYDVTYALWGRYQLGQTAVGFGNCPASFCQLSTGKIDLLVQDVSVIPIPASFFLFISGLIALSGMVRRSRSL